LRRPRLLIYEAVASDEEEKEECDVMQCGRQIVTFWINLLLTSSQH
jgi:hypothetical protein